MKFVPKVSLLKSFRGERVKYSVLVGEAVDNAFDADARRIAVNINPDSIRFEDDGIGVTKNRIESLFSLGDHGAMTSTQLGRFGIGIKSQAINAGDVLTVKSTSIDGCFWVQVNWRKVLASDRWESDDPTWIPVIVGAHTGTSIEISALRPPEKYTPEKIIEDLAQRFHPAIAEGKTIRLNGALVPLLNDPRMTDLIEKTITLSDGRHAKVKAGILAEPSKLCRVHVSFRHRVIMPNSTVGCGDYGGLNKMFARLQLSGVWHLGKYKDDLTDESERDELEFRMEETLRPILEKCNAASIDARIDALGQLINEKLAAEIASARPRKVKKRDPDPNRQKRKRKTGHTEPEKSEPNGPAKAKHPQFNKLLITFEGKNEDDGIGSFQPGKITRVNLSPDNPMIKSLIARRDQDLVAESLIMVAFAIFEHGRQDRQPELPFEPFGVRVAKLLALNSAKLSEDTVLQSG